MTEFLETTVDKFVFKVATDRRYTAGGVWVAQEGAQLRLGVTDFRQRLAGDAAFVHLRAAGTLLSQGEEFAEIETIKATIGLAMPASGTIAAVNGALENAVELVNEDPYGKGWLVLVAPQAADWGGAALMDAQAYLAEMRRQAEEELAS